MALEKRRRLDQVEVLIGARAVQVRWVDEILEDGRVISQGYHRCACGDKAMLVEKLGQALADKYWAALEAS